MISLVSRNFAHFVMSLVARPTRAPQAPQRAGSAVDGANASSLRAPSSTAFTAATS